MKNLISTWFILIWAWKKINIKLNFWEEYQFEYTLCNRFIILFLYQICEACLDSRNNSYGEIPTVILKYILLSNEYKLSSMNHDHVFLALQGLNNKPCLSDRTEMLLFNIVKLENDLFNWWLPSEACLLRHLWDIFVKYSKWFDCVLELCVLKRGIKNPDSEINDIFIRLLSYK